MAKQAILSQNWFQQDIERAAKKVEKWKSLSVVPVLDTSEDEEESPEAVDDCDESSIRC